MFDETYFKNTVDSSADAIVVTDLYGIIEYINPAFTQLTGWSTEEALGQTPQILKSGKMPESVYEDIWATLQLGETWTGRLLNRRKSRAVESESASSDPNNLYWAQLTISPVKKATGERVGFMSSQRAVLPTAVSEEKRQKQNGMSQTPLMAGIWKSHHFLRSRVQNRITRLLGLETQNHWGL